MKKLYLLFASVLLMGNVFSMENCDENYGESQDVQDCIKDKQEKHRCEVREKITLDLLNLKRQGLIDNREMAREMAQLKKQPNSL
jgi:hypothetical protein